MTSLNDASEMNRTSERLADQKTHLEDIRLDLARQIAEETLKADRQALELDTRLDFAHG